MLTQNLALKKILVGLSLFVLISCSDDASIHTQKTGLTENSALETTESFSVASIDADSLQHINPNKANRNLSYIPMKPTEDIWSVLRKDLHLYKTIDVNNARVQAEIKKYIANPTAFKNTLADAGPFIFYIYKQTQAQGIPAEIALLPFVESSYNPRAYSPVGAAGLWQFMDTTSGDYGIVENWWYDGRLDIIASTNAALTYLTYLMQHFNGSWPLALAAYNSGEGTVRNAVRKSGSTNFWQLNLPTETKNYVPRLLAVSEIIRNPQKYNMQLPFIPNTPYFAVVRMKDEISLHVAAKLADITPHNMHDLNSGYKHETTSPIGPLRLLLPVTQVNLFKENLKGTPAMPQAGRFALVNWRYYTTHAGDSLASIASGFDTTIPAITENNQLRTGNLKTGTILKIPEASTTEQDLVTISNKAPTKVMSRSSAAQAKAVQYYVGPTDTLNSIAEHYNIDPHDIEKWNNLSNPNLITGQRLLIWEPAHHIDTVKPRTVNQKDSIFNENQATQQTASKKVLTTTNSSGKLLYTVKNGDTLSDIANRYGIDVNTLKQANNLKNDQLHIGEQLIIPKNIHN